MQNGQMSLNSEAVTAAYNQISTDIADIKSRIDRFMMLLEEKNAATKGKFALINRLQQELQKEVENVKHLHESVETIHSTLRRYEEMAADADDDSAFRLN